MWKVLFSLSEDNELVLAEPLEDTFENEELAKAMTDYEMVQIEKRAKENPEVKEVTADFSQRSVKAIFDDGLISVIKFTIFQQKA